MSLNKASGLKKSRQGRADKRQLSFMVDWLFQNKHVAHGKFLSITGKDDLKTSWATLVDELNLMGPANKDEKSWKNTWRDFKSKVSVKVAQINKERRRTGNPDHEIISLNEDEKKVLDIVGLNYAKGLTNCSDSCPEDLNTLRQLMTEEEEPSNKTVDASSTPPSPSIASNHNNTELEMEVANVTEIENPVATPTPPPKEQSRKKITTSRKGPKKNIRTNSNQRLGNQFQEARLHFSDLQKKQLEIFEKIVNIEERRLDFEQQRLDVDREAVEVLKALTNAINKFSS